VTPEQLQAAIDQIEAEIQTLGNQLDDQRRVVKKAIGRLNAQRDRLADELALHRAGLSRLIKPAGVATGEALGHRGAT